VKKRSQLQTKTMGIKTWIKRDTTTGALMGSEKGAGKKNLKKADEILRAFLADHRDCLTVPALIVRQPAAFRAGAGRSMATAQPGCAPSDRSISAAQIFRRSTIDLTRGTCIRRAIAVTVKVASASPSRLPKAIETARVPGTMPRSRKAYPSFLAFAVATIALSTVAPLARRCTRFCTAMCRAATGGMLASSAIPDALKPIGRLTPAPSTKTWIG
jgi:hypothetical protein